MISACSKSTTKIDQNYYSKLQTLTSKFGINATAVLLTDTREKSSCDTAAINAMQRMRGNMIHVVTVWRKEDIDDLGNTLRKIMEGTYLES